MTYTNNLLHTQIKSFKKNEGKKDQCLLMKERPNYTAVVVRRLAFPPSELSNFAA